MTTTTSALSVMDVVSPSVSFGEGVLAKAKENQRERAREDLLAVADVILNATRGELTRLDSAIAQLQSELNKLTKRRDVVCAAAAHADNEPNKAGSLCSCCYSWPEGYCSSVVCTDWSCCSSE